MEDPIDDDEACNDTRRRGMIEGRGLLGSIIYYLDRPLYSSFMVRLSLFISYIILLKPGTVTGLT